MPHRQSENFPKSVRLRKRGEYLDVQRRGRRVQSGAFVAVFKTRGTGGPRMGVTTTKRIGGAVVRNHIRRLVREAYRRRIMVIPDGLDVVIIAKTRASQWNSSSEIFSDLALLGHKLAKAVEPVPC